MTLNYVTFSNIPLLLQNVIPLNIETLPRPRINIKMLFQKLHEHNILSTHPPLPNTYRLLQQPWQVDRGNQTYIHTYTHMKIMSRCLNGRSELTCETKQSHNSWNSAKNIMLILNLSRQHIHTGNRKTIEK